ncbi:MAG: repeat-containing protein [Bacteroidetes bacterium]|nr:repeat-containing protein [Bacteroidota bacterium]
MGLLIMAATFFVSCQRHTAESWYKRAQVEVKANSLKRAVLDLNDAIAIDSAYADAYLLRGKIKVSLGENDSACKDAKKAADLGNKEAELIYQQYCKGLTDNEIKNRVRTQDSLVLLYPNRPEPLYNIGNVYFDAKQYKKSIEFCDKAISIDPKYAPAYYNKGVCLINLGDKVTGCELINKAASMGYDMALQMKPKCDALIKGM